MNDGLAVVEEFGDINSGRSERLVEAAIHVIISAVMNLPASLYPAGDWDQVHTYNEKSVM
jgi:hypothetical protein